MPALQAMPPPWLERQRVDPRPAGRGELARRAVAAGHGDAAVVAAGDEPLAVAGRGEDRGVRMRRDPVRRAVLHEHHGAVAERERRGVAEPGRGRDMRAGVERCDVLGERGSEFGLHG